MIDSLSNYRLSWWKSPGECIGNMGNVCGMCEEMSRDVCGNVWGMCEGECVGDCMSACVGMSGDEWGMCDWDVWELLDEFIN